MNQSTEELRMLLEHITNKRARIVIEHILEHGFITTEQLEKLYGYNHPPRAARDVREAGIPLETFRVKNNTGRTIAAYRFGDLSTIRKDRLLGRRAFPKRFKDSLYVQSDGKCAICSGSFEQRYPQVDHRVPYEVGGDVHDDLDSQDFMLICGSCNRAKSWSCEHCLNWQSGKSLQICLKCYWATPEDYVHVALKEVRRMDILWADDEILLYEALKVLAAKDHLSLPEYVKKVIAKHFADIET